MKPPKELSPAARKLWSRIYASAAEMDSAAMLLLNTLCQCWDRREEAREAIARDGLVLVEETAAGKMRRRLHPCHQVERDATAQLVRCWRALGFDLEPPRELGVR